MVRVEHIKTACALHREGFQEAIAQDLHARFGGVLTLRANHHGVEIESILGSAEGVEPIHNLIRDAIDADRAARGAAQAAPAYKDSTPELHVGESSFEGWFSEYDPAGKGDKQRARDAYAAGMGDPLVTAQPAPVAEDADPLQGAANWLVTSQTITSATTLGGRLCIGYNRAERLFNAARAQAAQPEGGNHG